MNAVRGQRVTMDAKGRLVLPRSVREAAGLSAGDGLVVSLDTGGAIRIEKDSARISRMQDRFAKYATSGSLASDELVAERRQQAEPRG